MGLYNVKSSIIRVKDGEKVTPKRFYTNEELAQFNPDILDIGKIGAKSERVDAIAAAFDLSGFTKFCNQRDPHLYVPAFLSEFLDWLFETLLHEMRGKEYENGKTFNSDLPFFSKFTGDGVILLWDAADLSTNAMCNVLIFMRDICLAYRNKFLVKTRDRYKTVPNALRCAVVRGDVHSIGDGKDFVGPCINIASRLLSYSGIMFCFSNVGFKWQDGMLEEIASELSVKRTLLRGMGQEEELICVREKDFKQLSDNEKRLFKDIQVK